MSGLITESVKALISVLNARGDDQADRDDDNVTSHQEVLKSLGHRGAPFLKLVLPIECDEQNYRMARSAVAAEEWVESRLHLARLT